ncbi:hypothetical protein ASswx1_3 [Aeromonas phage Asswx_1]|uniref:Uncharacterized protein n=2 Tax=Ceceduovirus aszj TaxID=2843652 RepID=A0A291LF13_9CAUD|nr:hypothetical protein [Aeromonas phage AS-szw]QAX97649.1 hypothetical protein ASswx1_3 [Aeromonas phage Asswx_1]QAX98903.1 hypothetical protein assk_106 [Aeromonas phage Assk]
MVKMYSKHDTEDLNTVSKEKSNKPPKYFNKNASMIAKNATCDDHLHVAKALSDTMWFSNYSSELWLNTHRSYIAMPILRNSVYLSNKGQVRSFIKNLKKYGDVSLTGNEYGRLSYEAIGMNDNSFDVSYYNLPMGDSSSNRFFIIIEFNSINVCIRTRHVDLVWNLLKTVKVKEQQEVNLDPIEKNPDIKSFVDYCVAMCKLTQEK